MVVKIRKEMIVMGLFEKIMDIGVNVQTAVDVLDMELQAKRGIRKSKTDKFYFLKTYDKYIEDDVKDIEKELRERDPLILARLYSIAYVDSSFYLEGEWKVGEEKNYFNRLTDDTIIQNKLKKLLVDYFHTDDGMPIFHDDFDRARIYIDLLETEEDFAVVLDDLNRAVKEFETNKSIAASKIRAYLKKRQATINGDSEGDESLARTLDDLI